MRLARRESGNSEFASTLNRTMDEVAPHLGSGQQKPDLRWRLIKHLHCRRSDVVFIRVWTGGKTREIVAKFLNAEAGATVMAEAEYSRLRHAAMVFDDCVEYNVPRPISCVQSTSAIVMERCRGPSLTRFITHSAWLSTPRRTERCVESVRQCARWLASYHRSREVTTNRRELAQSLIDSIRNKLVAVECKMGDVVSTAIRRQLGDKFLVSNDDSRWTSLELGLLHHDFGCHNVIVGERGIAVIDLGDACDGFALTDIERMRMELRVLDHARKLRRNRHLFETCIEAFDSEYAPADRADRSPFEVNCTLAFLLAIRRSKNLGRRFMQPWHAKAVRYLTSRLEILAV